MKKLLLALSSAVFALAAQGSTIAYSNLGPGDTYNQLHGDGIFNNGQLNQGWAMQFTAGATGNIATVDLGLTFGESDNPAPVNVFLYGNLPGVPADSPDNAMQTFLGMATPTARFTTTNNSIVTLNVAGIVPLTSGTKYWLGLLPTSADVQVWNQADPEVDSLVAFTNDGGATWFPSISPLSAFRITVNAAGVPDSGGTIVLMLCGIGMLIAFRSKLPPRRINCARS